MKKIPLSRVFVNEEVREAAIRALESGSNILTKECEAFEAQLADHTGTKQAVLCSSWAAAVFPLHRAMGVQPGDEVLVPSHTPFPSIEPMMHWGAKPVFIDIDETYCLDVIRTERRDALANYLQSKGISTGVHYPVPNHQQPAITKIYSNLPTLSQTEASVKEILSLPIYGELALEDVDYVCDSILQFLGEQ